MKSAAMLGAATAVAAVVAAGAASVQQGQRIPEPRRQFGGSVTGSFEGWFTNADGSRSFLLGYLNRNLAEEIDVPIGPNNRIEPGGPDMGQPTHFLPGRRNGMFIVPVPKAFTPQDRLTWTIAANGEMTAIPMRLHPDYLVNPFQEIAVGNTPPLLRFDRGGTSFQGPIAHLASAPARNATMTDPLIISMFVTDDLKYTSGTNAPISDKRPPVVLNWSKYRGPGTVTFDKARLPMERQPGAKTFEGNATTTARFSEPGDYVLHVVANDLSGEGGGGFLCCWTTGMMNVSVK